MCIGCLGFLVVKFFFSVEQKDRKEEGKATVTFVGKESKLLEQERL